jgi:hypothetical protein
MIALAGSPSSGDLPLATSSLPLADAHRHRRTLRSPRKRRLSRLRQRPGRSEKSSTHGGRARTHGAELEAALGHIAGHENVRVVALDMSDSYRSFVRRFIPNAIRVPTSFRCCGCSRPPSTGVAKPSPTTSEPRRSGACCYATVATSTPNPLGPAHLARPAPRPAKALRLLLLVSVGWRVEGGSQVAGRPLWTWATQLQPGTLQGSTASGSEAQSMCSPCSCSRVAHASYQGWVVTFGR